jgi:hypothetical protein
VYSEGTRLSLSYVGKGVEPNEMWVSAIILLPLQFVQIGANRKNGIQSSIHMIALRGRYHSVQALSLLKVVLLDQIVM